MRGRSSTTRLGVSGRISELKKDNLMIDFASKRGHTMSLKMAVNALLVLPKNHIWVIKSVFPKETLKEKVKKDVPWALRTVIQSFDNSLSMKRIKAELVPSVLTQNEWLSGTRTRRKYSRPTLCSASIPNQATSIWYDPLLSPTMRRR